MKKFRIVFALIIVWGFALGQGVSVAQGQDYSGGGQDDTNKKILKSGLLGAATGAIASGSSGGKAGQGALIGAGTSVIGGALLDSLTGSGPSGQQAQPVYVQQAPVYSQQGYSQPGYSQSSYPVQTQGTYRSDPPQPVYYQQAPPQEDPTKKILKSGLLGAGTGAIAASASGGKAGKGALIGAGTSVIGGALLDTLMGGGSQPQQQQVYVQQPVYQQPTYSQPNYSQASPGYGSSTQPKKKIIRKYDKDGNVVSEEEVWE